MGCGARRVWYGDASRPPQFRGSVDTCAWCRCPLGFLVVSLLFFLNALNVPTSCLCATACARQDSGGVYRAGPTGQPRWASKPLQHRPRPPPPGGRLPHPPTRRRQPASPPSRSAPHRCCPRKSLPPRPPVDRRATVTGVGADAQPAHAAPLTPHRPWAHPAQHARVADWAAPYPCGVGW